MLGTSAEEFLPAESRQHRGAGVSVYVRLPAATQDIAAVHRRHADAGVVTGPLSRRPWGEQAFDAVICGYKYLITQEPGPAD